MDREWSREWGRGSFRAMWQVVPALKSALLGSGSRWPQTSETGAWEVAEQWIPDCYMRPTVSSCSTVFNCWIILWLFSHILWSLNRRTNLQAQRVLNDAIKIQNSDWLEENLMRGSWVYPAVPALSGPVWGIILVSDPEICFTWIAVAMAVHFWQRYYSLIRDNTKEFRFWTKVPIMTFLMWMLP